MYAFRVEYTDEILTFNERKMHRNNEAITLTSDKRKALGLSGILAELNKSYHEKLEFTEICDESTRMWTKTISGEWGIENRE